MKDTSLKRSTIIEISVIRILIVVFQMAFIKIYSNYTSAYELGIYYFYFTASYSLNAFLLVPLDYFQQSKLYSLKVEGKSLKSYFKINAFVLKIIVGILLLGNIICAFIDTEYCLILTVITLLSASTYTVTLLRGIINNLERRRAAIYCLLLEYVLKIGFFFFYIKFYSATSKIILVSLLSASVVSLIVLFFVFKQLTEYKFKQIKVFRFRDIFQFSYPISISAVINWIQLQSYSLILVPLGLAEVVGVYATVANVGAGGMNAYSTIFSQLFVPNIYKSNGAYIKIYLRNAFLSILFVLVCSAFLSEIIIRLLTNPSFVKYASVILYGVACEAGNFLIGALTIFLTIKNVTKVTLKMSFAGLMTFIVSFSILYFVKAVNIFTIGIPMVATQLVICLGLLFEARKELNKY